MSRVALIGENSVEYVDKLLDIWNNGHCAVLLDWRIPLQTAIQMMREADAIKKYLRRYRTNEKMKSDLGRKSPKGIYNPPIPLPKAH